MEREAIENELKHIRESLVRIESLANKTNGRVTSLEKWKYGLVIGLGTLAATKWPILSVLISNVGG